MSGSEEFYEKYGIIFDDLVKIPKKRDGGFYKSNYDVYYHPLTDQVFSLWYSPYRRFIYIEDRGFITLDRELRKAYDDYIREHFR